jgi:4-diphosphocytidyl-2-C-methyl-D-erythritol kinase
VNAARSVTRAANAKLNVFLRILGVREDGYHDLESLVLPLSLTDGVTVGPADRLSILMTGEESPAPGADGGAASGAAVGMNLALVGALALADACPDAGGAEILITKRIPVAAGLGGGSADAAATLLALNDLWACGLDFEGLLAIAEQIGSDVPALLAQAPVLVRGRGEHIEPMRVPTTWWVVRPFDFPTRSPDAYRWWDEDGGPTGPEPGSVLAAAEAGDSGALGRAIFNDLEPAVVRRHPVVGDVKGALLGAGALGAVMSGSGPTVVALARDEAHAHELAKTQEGALVASGPPAR